MAALVSLDNKRAHVANHTHSSRNCTSASVSRGATDSAIDHHPSTDTDTVVRRTTESCPWLAGSCCPNVQDIDSHAAKAKDGFPAPEAATTTTGKAQNDGMLLERNFKLTFCHAAARIALHCSPQWEFNFIDPRDIATRHELNRDVAYSPITLVLSYNDDTDLRQREFHLDSVIGMSSQQQEQQDKEGNDKTAAAAAAHGEVYVSSDSTMWYPGHGKTKVEVYHTHVAPSHTLHDHCLRCVRHILHGTGVVSVDGDTDLTALRVGSKLRCPHRLAGERSFHFTYCSRNRHASSEVEVTYAVGTLVRRRGYLVLVHSHSAAALARYLACVFLPRYTDPDKLQLNDADADENLRGTRFSHCNGNDDDNSRSRSGDNYHPVPTSNGVGSPYSDGVRAMPTDYPAPLSLQLAEQQALFGVLRYTDHDAAVCCTLPVHPMRIRPDYSPVRTVGAGSIACMTFEMHVHERLIDDPVTAEMAGMPRHRTRTVLLGLDVEDVSRMGYPAVMSIEEYSAHKTARVLRAVDDGAVLHGSATTLQLGDCVSRARVLTFTYAPWRERVRVLMVSTLRGNYGVTALYLTRQSEGSFDVYLYLYEQLAKSLVFDPDDVDDGLEQQQCGCDCDAAAWNRRWRTVDCICLSKEDLARAYHVSASTADDSGTPCDASASNDEPESEGDDADGAENGTGAGSVPAQPQVASARAERAFRRHVHLMQSSALDGRPRDGCVFARVPHEHGGCWMDAGSSDVRDTEAGWHDSTRSNSIHNNNRRCHGSKCTLGSTDMYAQNECLHRNRCNAGIRETNKPQRRRTAECAHDCSGSRDFTCSEGESAQDEEDGMERWDGLTTRMGDMELHHSNGAEETKTTRAAHEDCLSDHCDSIISVGSISHLRLGTEEVEKKKTMSM